MLLLCTGDLHLGRRSSRLPAHLDGPAHATAAAWGRIVEHALEAGVDVVVLSGDVVDRENRFYEAIGPLERGIRRLSEAGIDVVAVAGNHDHDVFPRLAAELPSERFHFLGRGGVWERVTIARDAERLHVVGWSFPEARVHESPVASLGSDVLPEDDGAPVLGVVHADLDQQASPYAPVSLAALRAVPVDFWLLGHVHAPRLFEAPGAAPVLYPGSPQAMDPGESGAHGVWLVETAGARISRVRPVALSSVRYETVEVDVDGVDDVGALDARVAEVVRGLLTGVAAGAGSLRVLSCRLRLTGRTSLQREIAERAGRIVADLALDEGLVTAVVDRVEDETRPARDLDALARGNDPVAVVARLLLSLERGTLDDAQARLLADATSRVSEVRRARAYVALPGEGDEPPEAVARVALARQASLLLDELLAQKEGA